MSKPNAVHSLYGGKEARALSGNVGKPKRAREQVVLTPMPLLAQIANGECPRPYLDPATERDNPTNALNFYTAGDDGSSRSWTPAGGLSAPYWVFVNPPYGQLQKWMEKAADEAERGCRITMLIPFRSQRDWFCAVAARPAACLQSLKPLAFVGHDQDFPAPLCLLHFNRPPLEALYGPPKPKYPDGKQLISATWRAEIVG